MADKWFKFEVERWEHGTADLDWDVEYAFFRIILFMNAYDSPIKNDMNVLKRIFKCNDARPVKRWIETLKSRGKILERDGWISNPKAEKTIKERAKFSDLRRKSGQLGGKSTAKRLKKLEAEAANAAHITGHNRTVEDITEDKKERERGKTSNGHATVRGSRLKDDWQADEEDIRFAISLGFTDDEIKKMFSTFRDYWIAQPSPRGVKVNWSATLRNWVRKEHDTRRSH